MHLFPLFSQEKNPILPPLFPPYHPSKRRRSSPIPSSLNLKQPVNHRPPHSPPMSSPPPPHHNLTLDFKSSKKPDESHPLEDFLSRLQQERTKIDAFKRELPLCMQLLTNAMENSRDQLQKWKLRRGGSTPVLEEFIPLKGSRAQKEAEKGASELEKTCWMTSVQLWSQGEEEEKLSLDSRHRTRGAFLPFSKDGRNISEFEQKEDEKLEEKQHESMKCSNNDSSGISFSVRDTCVVEEGKAPQNTCVVTNASVSNGQSNRKARRCWSPELHRRFINALQMLGGSQVATPKQIRELMKVEGLTNDEVKSHLQKYRLHTRRPGGVVTQGGGGGGGGPQLVVLGGIWVPPEYTTHVGGGGGGGGATIYSTHSSPPTFTAPHEFYPVTPMAHALARTHRHHYQQQEEEEEENEYELRMYRGYRAEEESEGVSKSTGEMNIGSKVRRSSVMEEGDESNNVSEITLKV